MGTFRFGFSPGDVSKASKALTGIRWNWAPPKSKRSKGNWAQNFQFKRDGAGLVTETLRIRAVFGTEICGVVGLSAELIGKGNGTPTESSITPSAFVDVLRLKRLFLCQNHGPLKCLFLCCHLFLGTAPNLSNLFGHIATPPAALQCL